jgi:hypothetical protein
MTRNRLFSFWLSLSLSGAWAAQAHAQDEAYWDALRARCTQYGFKAGTDAFAQCVQKEARAAETRAAQKAASNPPRQTTTCTRDMLGNINCTTR